MAGARALRIGISGGGPSGLLLASLLNRSAAGRSGRFSIHVFERGRRLDNQGAGWDIDTDGQRALRRAGVDPDSISRQGSGTFRVYRTWEDKPCAMVSPPKLITRYFPADPETNRKALIDGLLTALGDEVKVQFESGVESIGMCGDGSGGAELFGAGGHSLGAFDIVVDASGVSSSLRRFRVRDFDLASTYSGLTMIHGTIPDPDATCDSEVVKRLGQGTVSVIGDRGGGVGGSAMFLQRFGADLSDHSTSFGYFLARENPGDVQSELGLPRGGSKYLSVSGDQVEKDRFLGVKSWLKDVEMGEKWDPMWRTCVDSIETLSVFPLFHFPHDPVFIEDELPLICIGDALHGLPPYTGMGGNVALGDAVTLADFLIKDLESESKASWVTKVRDAFRRKSASDSGTLVGKLRKIEAKMLKETEIPSEATRKIAEFFVSRKDEPDFMKRLRLTDFVRPKGRWDGRSAMFMGIAWLLYKINEIEGFGL